MRRLATDARMRATLGKNAEQLWQERFTLDMMVARYRQIIAEAYAAPPPDRGSHADWPAHLLTDGTERTSDLLERMQIPHTQVSQIWRGGSEP